MHRHTRQVSRLAAVLVAFAIALCMQAGAAFGATYYVNPGGMNSYDCLAPTGGGPAGPCQTIAGAVSKAVTAGGTGHEILLADATYNESVTLSDQMVLSSSDGDVGTKPVVNGTTTINATGASVDHLELKGAPVALHVTGAATISDNSFTETTAPSAGLVIQATLDPVAISRNSFTDDGAGSQTAINSQAPSPDISIEDNTVTGLATGIFAVTGDVAAIRRNVISGVHDGGYGILFYEGSPEVTENTVQMPGAGNNYGIYISHTNGPAAAGLARNRVLGSFLYGVTAFDTSTFTLNGDVIAGSSATAIYAGDSPMAGSGDVAATNVTLYGNGSGGVADGALLSLNSVITETGPLILSTGSCAISYSRGPIPVPPTPNPADCDDFQTNAAPMFVNPGAPAYDYHLAPGSPMIDAGDPAPAAPGSLDLDAGPRVLEGNGVCPSTRDIGADEFAGTAPLDCSAATAPPAAAPSAAIPKKKCKKRRKLVRRKGKLRCIKKKKKK